jgi:hypothetical protein
MEEVFVAIFSVFMFVSSITLLALFGVIFYIRILSVFIYKTFRDNEKVKQDLFRSYWFLRKYLEIPDSTQVNLQLKMPQFGGLCQGYIKKDLAFDEKAGQNCVPVYTIVIFLNSYYANLLDVLSHEMVHLQQYCEGRLDSNSVTRYWHGKVFCEDNVEYEDLPWEKEAFERQSKLTDIVFNRLFYKKTPLLHRIYRKLKY